MALGQPSVVYPFCAFDHDQKGRSMLREAKLKQVGKMCGINYEGLIIIFIFFDGIYLAREL